MSSRAIRAVRDAGPQIKYAMLQSVFGPLLVSTFSLQLPATSFKIGNAITAKAAPMLHKAIQAAL